MGIENMAVVITDTKTGKRHVTYTYSWGSFIYMGLTCGSYTVDLHPAYLKQMKLKKQNPDFTHVLQIAPSEEGKQIDSLDFELLAE